MEVLSLFKVENVFPTRVKRTVKHIPQQFNILERSWQDFLTKRMPITKMSVALSEQTSSETGSMCA